MEQLSILKNNLEMQNQIFVAVDVETTGFSPIKNELIEVSAIKYNGNKKLDTFTTLIKPKEEVPYVITKVTGITNQMLRKAPKVEEIMPKLISFIGSNPIVAHNAKFDYSFLQANSNKSFSNNELIDTLEISRQMFKNLPNYKLNTISKIIGIEEDSFHRAEFDSECCAKIYMKYLEEYK